MIRYYGHYSQKARGIRAKYAAAFQSGADQQEQRPGQCKADQDQPILGPPAPLRGRGWAILIPAQDPRTLRPLTAAAIPWSACVNPISPCGKKWFNCDYADIHRYENLLPNPENALIDLFEKLVIKRDKRTCIVRSSLETHR